jgi:proteic killer suppression protein
MRGLVIKSFKDKDTEDLYHRIRVARFRAFERRARLKLRMLNAAAGLLDLASPPGNRLERLSGSRKGQHSIQINDQWRLCFRWHDLNAYDVEITDYH